MTDGRLLVPAAAAWGGALLGTVAIAPGSARSLVPPAAVIAVVALAGGLVCGMGALLTVRRRTPPGRGTVVLLAGCALAAGLLSAALRAEASGSQPLAGWAAARATASVEGVIVAEPRLRTFADAAPWQASRVLEVLLASSRVTARGATIAVEIPVLLRIPVDERVPAPGTVVQANGRLGARPGPDVFVALTASTPVVELAGPGPVDAAAHAMREGLRRAVAPLDPDAGALVAGLAVGDESGQSVELDEAMRASGLAHLTAVSGGNVAIVVATVVGGAVLVGLSLLARVVLAGLALTFFVVLVGFQPSVLRAATMGAVVLVALLIGGRRPGPSVLATAVIVLVIVSPALAASWGFALSVVATGALVLLAPLCAIGLSRWPATRRWPPALRGAVAVALAAQAGTAPILLLMGASVGWVAVPANLLAMPAVPAVTILGLAAALVSPVLPGLADVLAFIASWPAAWIAAVAERASALPGAQLPIPAGPVGVLVLGAGACVAIGTYAWVRRNGPLPRGLRRASLGLVLAVTVLWLLLPPSRRAWPPEDWLMIMCDVGQGDALLLRAGHRAAVVVDAGPDPERVDRCLDDADIALVPALLLTHLHADHVAGLPGVLRDRRVGRVLVTPLRDPVDQAVAVDDWLGASGLRATMITAGDQRIAGSVSWRALWPRRVIDAGSVPNNASIVLDVTVADRRVLLTGDVEAEAQVAVAASLSGERYDAVKVPHHGSANQADLPRWAPTSFALVSVGEGNPYGHPAESTLAAWQQVGATVLRTDRDGDVAIVRLASGVGAVTRD